MNYLMNITLIQSNKIQFIMQPQNELKKDKNQNQKQYQEQECNLEQEYNLEQKQNNYKTIMDNVINHRKKILSNIRGMQMLCVDLDRCALSDSLTDDEQFNTVMEMKKTINDIENMIEFLKCGLHSVPIYSSSSTASYFDSLKKNLMLFQEANKSKKKYW